MKIITKRIAKDKETLAALKSRGDDEELVRIIDHSFVAEAHDALVPLADNLLHMGFSGVSIDKHPESDIFVLECTSFDCTEFHSVVKSSVLMALLAKTYTVKYEGWGCSVAKES
ncbi:ribonuclease E inhibitor RraB [Agaribacter marinus]|uniref:Regulator of ribonuclease activity B domain-containing protein n=1 Tax=Agaribacter marinus TaxID=1431249 RepID=A0AA37T6C9_9ALTE|nr:ribonuclease E inhibitor RraB [Agaribacter marinus]GLR72205.1 hypothetical protein GCM10007852_31130 [Agaribacter marinus]